MRVPDRPFGGLMNQQLRARLQEAERLCDELAAEVRRRPAEAYVSDPTLTGWEQADVTMPAWSRRWREEVERSRDARSKKNGGGTMTTETLTDCAACGQVPVLGLPGPALCFRCQAWIVAGTVAQLMSTCQCMPVDWVQVSILYDDVQARVEAFRAAFAFEANREPEPDEAEQEA
jgi:hypothetical protein